MLRFAPYLFVLVVGAFLGSLITHGVIDQDEVLPAVAPEAALSTPSEEVVIEEENPVSHEDSGSSSPPNSIDGSLLSRAIAEVSLVGEFNRDGTITGQVVTVTGEPVEGVEVSATAGRRPNREEVSDNESKVRRYIRDLRWQDKTRSTAVTDSDGRYQLLVDADIEYRLRAEKRGFTIRASASRDIRSGDVVDFTATAVTELEVTVLRPDGSEPEQAQLSVRHGNSSRGERWSQSRRLIPVKPCIVSVTATNGDGERGVVEDLEIQAGSGVMPITIQLAARGAIRGKVRGGPDEVAATATVYLVSAALISNPTPQQMLASDQRDTAYSGREFTFSDLDPGGYWIGVARGHRHDEALPAISYVEVESELVEVELDLPALKKDEGVIVYAYSPDGALLTDAGISFAIVSPNRTSSGMGNTTRLKDGGVLLRPDEELEGRLEGNDQYEKFVSVRHQSFGTQRVAITDVRGQLLDVHFEAPAYAMISIPGYVGGEFVGHIRVTLTSYVETEDAHLQNTLSDWNGSDKPDLKGEVRFGPVKPGAYTLIFAYDDSKRNSFGNRGTLTQEIIQLAPGNNNIARALPQIYSLEVNFPEEIGEGNLQIERVGEDFTRTRYVQLNGTSTVVVKGLAAGEYLITAWGGNTRSQASMRVTVPCAPITYDPPPVNAMAVMITDSTGKLAQAGFVDGDLIRKINGQAFEGGEQLALMGAFLQQSSEVTFTVDRDGLEVDIVISPQEMMSGNPGGRFMPTSQ